MAVTAQSSTSVDTLASLNKANSTRRARPPTVEAINGTDGTPRQRLSTQLQKQESKTGLRGFFGRSKAEKRATMDFTAISPPVPENIARSHYESQAPPAKKSRSSIGIEKSRPFSIMGPSVSTSSPAPSLPRSSTLKSPRPDQFRARSPVRANTMISRPIDVTTTAAWEAPPLFQAFPQAVRHALLPALSISADSVIRMSNHKRNTSIRDEMAQTQDAEGPSQAPSRIDKARKHRRQISDPIARAEWTRKIYVLVTSGYLLQYSGEGVYDRLPEKVMQLGKDSVAFASDVIPGKHWVLQISQAMNDDGTPVPDSRSLLSRLSLRGDYRRSATSFLLVFESAEEMEAWIVAIRKEIENLGGKKGVTETGEPKNEQQNTELKHQTSSRYLVTRQSQLFSSTISAQTGIDSPILPAPRSHDELNFHRTPTAEGKPSPETQSITTDTTSHDGRQLDSLRDSIRHSYMSSGQGTTVTSRASSPSSSPIKETFDEISSIPERSESRPRPNAAAIRDRRRSMQTQPQSLPVEADFRPAQKPPRPKSAFGHLSGNIPMQEPMPLSLPNFSMPHHRSEPSAVAVPAVAVAQPVMIKETPAGNPTRNVPTLNVIVPPSTTKAVGSPSHPPVYTPTATSFKKLKMGKPELITIPARNPRSPLSPATSSPASATIGRSHRASMISLQPPSKSPTLIMQKRHSSAINLSSPASTLSPSASPTNLNRIPSLPSLTSSPSSATLTPTLTPTPPIPPIRQFAPQHKRPSTLERPKTADSDGRKQGFGRQRPISMQPPVSMKNSMPPINFSRPVSASQSSPRRSTFSSSSFTSRPVIDATELPPFVAQNRPATAFALRLSSPEPLPVRLKLPERIPLKIRSADSTPVLKQSPEPPSGPVPAPSPAPLKRASTQPALQSSPQQVPLMLKPPQPPPYITRTASPTLQRLRQEKPKIGGRRSMPLLVKPKLAAGPPPAPPPNCALPPLPPAAIEKREKRKSLAAGELERSKSSLGVSRPRTKDVRRSLAI